MLNTFPLSTLANLPEPVLTVYLDTNPVRHVNRNADHGYLSWFRSRSRDLLASLDESERSRARAEIDRAAQFLARHPHTSQGLAIFSGLGAWEVFELRAEPVNELHWGQPMLWQLCVIADRCPPSCIAIFNGTGLRLFSLRQGTLAPLETLDLRINSTQWKQMQASHAAERRVGMAHGPQRDLFERRLESQVLRLLGVAADRIQAACSARDLNRIVLWGAVRYLRFIESKLPPSLKRQIICIPHGWQDEDGPGSAALILENLHRFELSRKQNCVEELAARSPGVVTGVEETLAQLQRGRLATLFVAEDFNPALFCCTVCKHVVASSARTCARCNGEQRKIMLRDILPQLLVFHGCEGEFLNGPSAERLRTCGNMGGQLRQKPHIDAAPALSGRCVVPGAALRPAHA